MPFPSPFGHVSPSLLSRALSLHCGCLFFLSLAFPLCLDLSFLRADPLLFLFSVVTLSQPLTLVLRLLKFSSYYIHHLGFPAIPLAPFRYRPPPYPPLPSPDAFFSSFSRLPKYLAFFFPPALTALCHGCVLSTANAVPLSLKAAPDLSYLSLFPPHSVLFISPVPCPPLLSPSLPLSRCLSLSRSGCSAAFLRFPSGFPQRPLLHPPAGVPSFAPGVLSFGRLLRWPR